MNYFYYKCWGVNICPQPDILVRAKSTEKQWMGWVISAPPHFEGINFHFSIIFKQVSIDIQLGLYVKKRSTIKIFTLFPKLTEIERKIRSGENIFSPKKKMGWDIRLPHFEGIIFHFSIIFKPVSIDIPLGLYVKKRSTIKNFTLFRKLTEIERKIRSGENIFSPSEKIFLTQKKYCPSTK